MQRILLLILLFFSVFAFSQNWKDQKAEKLFLENNFIEAKKYLESKLNTETSLSIEEKVYLQSKLSHSYLRTGDFDTALQYAKKSNAKFSQIKVVQVVSPIGRRPDQKQTLIGLGLNKMHKERVLEDTNSIRGMINKVRHLFFTPLTP